MAKPCADCHAGIEDIQPDCTRAILENLNARPSTHDSRPSQGGRGTRPGPSGQDGRARRASITTHDDPYCLFCHLPSSHSEIPPDLISRPILLGASDSRLPTPDSRAKHHPPIVRNPSDLRLAPLACGPCHPQNVEGILHSPHATTVGQIRVILRSFVGDEIELPRLTLDDVKRMKPSDLVGANSGASESGPMRIGPYEPRVRRVGTDSDPSASEPLPLRLQMGFDLIRKACITCHLGSENRSASTPEGNFRSSGCAACHVPYATDGRRQTADNAMQSATSPGPTRHQMTVKIPVSQCETCHNGSRKATSYRGLFPADGLFTPTDVRAVSLHGGTYESVAPDVHYTAGMVCIDCHTESELMRSGPDKILMEDHTTITCEACHVASASPSGHVGTDSHPSELRITRSGDQPILHRRLDNQPLPIPQLSAFSIQHSALEPQSSSLAHTTSHLDKVECVACHTQWTARCYLGCHMEYDERKSAPDLQTGQRSPGAWTLTPMNAPTGRNYPVFGKRRDKLALFVPSSQVLYTVTSSSGRRLLDRQPLMIAIHDTPSPPTPHLPTHDYRLPNFSMNPSSPHTVGRQGVTCDYCHGPGGPCTASAGRATRVRRGIERCGPGGPCTRAPGESMDSEPLQRECADRSLRALGLGTDLYADRPGLPAKSRAGLPASIDFPLNALLRPDGPGRPCTRAPGEPMDGEPLQHECGTPLQVTHHPNARPLTLEEIRSIREKAACLTCHGQGIAPASFGALRHAILETSLPTTFILKHYLGSSAEGFREKFFGRDR
ncbi:MAG: hypothetical protein HYY13_02100 [Nitrospirae bacterium]|nr:hypothetical protein [Nitrospirota bacterium]